MANYCGECALWQGSSDSNRYGERWCSHSRRYEKSDQNADGCRSFTRGETSSSGGCFLTSACVEAMGLPDDCVELTTLRRLRDEWLVLQPGGQAEIDEYYRIAPCIVEKLHSEPDGLEILRRMYREQILPCVTDALAGKPADAHRRYREMVDALKEKYC